MQTDKGEKCDMMKYHQPDPHTKWAMNVKWEEGKFSSSVILAGQHLQGPENTMQLMTLKK